MPSISVLIKSNSEPTTDLKSIINMLNGLSSGAIRGSAYIQTSGSNPVSASATATLATAVADNAIVIGIT